MADAILEQYRIGVEQRTGLVFPRFAEEAVHTAPILAVLQNPGNSGAERTLACSLNNPDPTARRQKRIIGDVGLRREQIVFWNFFAAFGSMGAIGIAKRSMWASELERLIRDMKSLRAVIVFGDEAWRGMREVEIPRDVLLIGAPHPSNRSCNSNPDAENQIRKAWARAKDCLA
jgi:hypothetical protein